MESSKAAIAKFASDLVENPAHTLDFGRQVFVATAELTVWEQILQQAEAGVELREVVDFVVKQMVQHAISPRYSTSASANLLWVETTAAYAKAFDLLGRRLRHED